jgi:hypothetical protein
MAAKKTASGMDFIIAFLKKNRKAAYADVRGAAEKKGLLIYPIMYGRAQALLGIVKSSPRGSKKKAAAKSGRGPGRPPKIRRGPGRPRKASNPLDALQTMVADYRDNAREVERMRKVLASIRDLCDRQL